MIWGSAPTGSLRYATAFADPSPLDLLRNRRKLLHGRLHIVRDLLGQHIRIRQIVGFFQAFIPEPEYVKVYLIALQQLFVVEHAPAAIGGLVAPGRLAAVAVGGVIAFGSYFTLSPFPAS